MFDFDVVTGSAGQLSPDKAETERRPRPDERVRFDTVRPQVGSPFLSSLPGLTQQSRDPRVKPGGDENTK